MRRARQEADQAPFFFRTYDRLKVNLNPARHVTVSLLLFFFREHLIFSHLLFIFSVLLLFLTSLSCLVLRYPIAVFNPLLVQSELPSGMYMWSHSFHRFFFTFVASLAEAVIDESGSVFTSYISLFHWLRSTYDSRRRAVLCVYVMFG